MSAEKAPSLEVTLFYFPSCAKHNRAESLAEAVDRVYYNYYWFSLWICMTSYYYYFTRTGRPLFEKSWRAMSCFLVMVPNS